VKIAGEVKDFNPADYGIETSFARKQDKFSVYAVAAAWQAMNQSGLSSATDGNIDPFRLGVYVGSGIGGFSTQVRETEKILSEGPKWVSPLFVPTMIANIAAGNIAIRNNACGPCLSVSTACSTSTHAIGEAYRAIKHGYADAIIAGGAEAVILPLGIAGFANAKALSRSEDPKYASLPFNKNRGGFVMSEGAAILVLEEYEHAIARGAEILAEVCGYGNTCDAHHVTAPRPDGITQAAAFRQALDEAGYTSDDVLYINAHGTGTALNDVSETLAFKNALGEDAYKAHISSIKGSI
jgi:3-oxoacyl-[acyl-carrier-protein] synthase II